MDNILVPTTDALNDLQRCLAAAANGQRFIVLGHDGAPTAGIIGPDDLRRLISAEGYATQTPHFETGETQFHRLVEVLPAGTTAIGVHADGSPATLQIRAHNLIVGRNRSRRPALLTSALAGAMLTTPATEIGFLIASGAPTTGLPGEILHAAHVHCSQTNVFDRSEQVLLFEQLTGEVDNRRTLLRKHQVASTAELRALGPAIATGQPRDLIVVIDGPFEIADPGLAHLIEELLILEDTLGIYLWLSNPVPLHERLMNVILNRVGLQTFSCAHSDTVIGIPDAALISEPGVGFVKPHRGQPRLFRVIPPTTSDLSDIDSDSQPSAASSRWSQLPPSVSLAETVARWEAAGGIRNEAQVPIGLVNEASEHVITPFVVDFAETRVLSIIGGNADHLTDAVCSIVAAAEATNDDKTLNFVYTGFTNVADHMVSLMNRNMELVSVTDKAHTTNVLERLTQRITSSEGEDAQVVLIIDGWTRWNRDHDADIILKLIQDDVAGTVHVIVTDTDGYHMSRLEPVLDQKIELRLSAGESSAFNATVARAIPDRARHALTASGRLIITDPA